MLDQRELAHTRMGLAQLDMRPLGKPDQDLVGAVEKPRIGREHQVLGYTVVSTMTRLSSDGLIASVSVATERLSCSKLQLFRAHPLAPARQ